MSTETLIIEGRLIHVDYDSEPDESPSMYSPGHPGGLCVNKVTLKDGTDALPFVMAVDNETEEQAMAWIERMLDHKLKVQAEDQQGERMRSGRRSW